MKLWPWTRKVIERGKEMWKQRTMIYGYQVGDPREYARDFVVYEVTNHWTGSVTIEKVYLS